MANKAGTTFVNETSSAKGRDSSRNSRIDSFQNLPRKTRDFSRSRQRSKQVFNTAERSRSRSAVRKSDDTCKYCSKKFHNIYNCRIFADLTTSARWRWVKKEKLCFKCINAYHKQPECNSSPCSVNGCGRPHHTLLHSFKYDEKNSTVEVVNDKSNL